MRKDAVPPEVRRQVLLRDKCCFMFRLDQAHVCRDRFGVHSPYDLNKLTMDHVHARGGMMGKRAPSDAEHMVAMCWEANVACPTRLVRQEQRRYLQTICDAAMRNSPSSAV